MSYKDGLTFPFDGRFCFGANQMIVSSSDLDWRPGFWPLVIAVGEMTFERAGLIPGEGDEFPGYVYKCPLGGQKLLVLND